MAFLPGSGRASSRRRDERGVAFPSPLVMLSGLAVAMASITFVATRDQAPTERRVDTATIASADRTPSAEPTPTPTPTKTPKPKPQLVRGEVYVEVFNNSGIKGLAAGTAAKATQVGWAVVGEDNWYGVIPTTTGNGPGSGVWPSADGSATVAARLTPSEFSATTTTG